MTKDLISVVITTYKRPISFLDRAIESVIRQSFAKWELIIIDDSGEHSENQIQNEEYIKKYRNDSRVRYYYNKVNIGAQQSRNKGIELSTGEYVSFLDDDDEWLPTKLEKQLNVFKNGDKDLGLVSCFANVIDDNNKISRFFKIDKVGYVYEELLKENIIGSTSFPLIKRKCFFDCGVFDINFPAKQDYDMWMRICEKYKIDVVKEFLVKYYEHNHYRISKDYKTKIDAEKMFLHKYFNVIKFNTKVLGYKYQLIGKLYYKANNPRKARDYYKKSFKIDKKNFRLYALYFFSYLIEYKKIQKIKQVIISMR